MNNPSKLAKMRSGKSMLIISFKYITLFANKWDFLLSFHPNPLPFFIHLTLLQHPQPQPRPARLGVQYFFILCFQFIGIGNKNHIGFQAFEGAYAGYIYVVGADVAGVSAYFLQRPFAEGFYFFQAAILQLCI